MITKPELISNIYDCAVNDTRWDEVIDKTVSYAGARGALLGAVSVSEASTAPAWSLASGSQCWRDLSYEQREYIKANFLPHQLKTWKMLSEKDKLGFVFDGSGYQETAHLMKREDYVFRREQLGIVRSIVFRLNSDLGWFDSLAVHFGLEYQTVPRQSQLLLTEIVPHVSKSVELARTFGLLKQQYKAVLGALDHVSIGLCIVLSNRVVAVSNTEALRIFDEVGVVRLDEQKRLVSNSKQTNDLLNQAIDKANNMPAISSLEYENVFRIEDNNSRSVLVETTHLRDSQGELGEPLNCVLVSIVDLENTNPINTDRLSKVYALTSAETAVCSLLVRGHTNGEIAEHRNVSPQTIKTQVSSIYIKTAVHNRLGLIRLALQTTPPVRMS